jgi:hypothetical protein
VSLFIFARLTNSVSIYEGRNKSLLLTCSETTPVLDADLVPVSLERAFLDERHPDAPVLRIRSSETEFVDE